MAAPHPIYSPPSILHRSSSHRVEAFDERAAVELAMRLRDSRRAGDPREGLKITKGEKKFDRRIVAIALVSGAAVLYSDDIAVAKFAVGCGLPTHLTQLALEFTDPPASGEAPAA